MPFKSTPGVFRSLRYIAEQKNTRFAPPADYDAVAGVPAGVPGTAAGSRYEDVAEQVKPSQPSGSHTAFSLKGS